MKILINHLTRMHGGHICVAGVDLQTRRHVRPVMQQWGMPCELLARYGGPFDMARIVELGNLRPKPSPPHVEDVVYVSSWAKAERTAEPHEFWNLLHELAGTRLRDIFGSALRRVGQSRWGTDIGRGSASLGCLRPNGKPQLYLGEKRDGKRQIRIKLSDGEVRADASVTDLRLFRDDHATPDADLVRGVAKWIQDSDCVLLGVGLTRPYRPSEDSDALHWLQVNNIYLQEDPVWQLG